MLPQHAPALRSLTVRHPPENLAGSFPFSVPAIRSLPTLSFPTPVTFLVGENGSGKSTLLEAVAHATALPAVGSELRVNEDQSLQAQQRLAAAMQLTWSRGRTPRGFFLRAEDFFGFTRTLARMRAGFLVEMAEIEREYVGRSAYARALRLGPIAGSLRALEERYGVDLDAHSHGESFLALFRSRFVPRGLHLLDEPEAALSPQSQLALLSLLKEMTAHDAQFIIATHSPILLAFPGATIYSFDESPVRAVAYDELEHVALTRDFLADPARFLRHL
ncbi:MAG: AAA family ATPase [Gemmatimonadaceae bacterium]|nr:AAA family ATPase [Gemmatimonadaceae bacterium]